MSQRNMMNGWLVKLTLSLQRETCVLHPPRREIVKWILAAWDGLDKTMIINSFKSCALTIAVDGSEDGHIHCFKENQPCRAGLERLKVVQQAMSISRDKDPCLLYTSDAADE